MAIASTYHVIRSQLLLGSQVSTSVRPAVNAGAFMGDIIMGMTVKRVSHSGAIGGLQIDLIRAGRQGVLAGQRQPRQGGYLCAVCRPTATICDGQRNTAGLGPS